MIIPPSKFDPENETGKILVRLMESQMGMTGRVAQYNQKWMMPTDDGLYLVIRYLWSKPIGNRVTYAPPTEDADGLKEMMGMQVQERYALELLSRSTEARMRKHEVLFSLASTESQQVQEENNLKIATLTSDFRDTSYLDGAAILNRFSLEVNILRAYRRVRTVDYYDKFQIPPIVYPNP